MDCIVHGVTKSRTRLSDFHFILIHVLKKYFLEIHKENFKEQVKRLDLPNFQTYMYISTDPFPAHNVIG